MSEVQLKKRKVKPPAHVKVRVQSDYSRYKKEIQRLLDKSGAGFGWEIHIRPRLFRDEATHVGECVHGYRDRWAIFGWSQRGYVADVLPGTPESIAKHEFGHFITARMAGLGEDRFVGKDEWTEAKEEFARMMEKLL